MQSYNISQAKAQLSAILEKVVAEGEEVIISKAGRPVARLAPFHPGRHKRRLGLFKGKIAVPKDFKQWPPDIAKALGIID